MPDKVLVTGGAGFIGSHLSRILISEGYGVVILDNLSGGYRANVPENCEFIEGSITDTPLVNALFEKLRFRFVFHLAAFAAEVLSNHIKHFTYSNNVLGSINLINASVNYGTECFVFLSSIAVYGNNPVPMIETMIPRPEDSYGIAKYAVELELENCRKQFGMDYVIFRPHNVYGEFQNFGDRYRNVIAIFMNQVLSNKPLTVFGDGKQTRAFSYIGDVAPLIAKSLRINAARNEVFNIGNDTPYTVQYLAETVCRAFNVQPEIRYLEARNEVKNAFSSHDKLNRIFQNCPPCSLEDGIMKMADWARSVGPQEQPAFSNVEITKKMPSYWRN